MSPAELSRRAFLARMGAIAFAVPVITSFTLDAVESGASGQPHAGMPNQLVGNQASAGTFFGGNEPTASFANQTFPNQYGTNALAPTPKQNFANQLYGNQYSS
jgi:hypothetical protein